MAAVISVPVSMPTSLGAREVVDLAQPVVNFQRLEDPQTSLHQCATKYGPQVVRSIFEKLVERDMTATFEEINLCDNKIGDEGAAYLSEGLSGNTTLKRLYLARADVRAAGFKSIGGLLAACPNLDEILLSSNIAGAEGLKGAFCDGLAKNKTLKSLYLGACRLGNAGVEPLLKGPMKSHPALQHLSLTYNRLDAASVAAINTMLASNSALRYLDLSGNSLGPEGCEALASGLKSNKGRLQKLSVAQNEARQAGCKALVDFFMSPQGKDMEFLDVRHNLVTYPGVVEMRKAMGRPIDTTADSSQDNGWLQLFGTRQLFLNAH